MPRTASVRCLALVLLAGAALSAPAQDPASLWTAPVDSRVVDDATLDATRGRFYGADMLVGVRIDLVSSLSTAQGGQAQGQGSLYLVRNAAGGFDVHLDTRSSASANGGGAAGAALATGGDGLAVDGIGQVTQIAGDGNRLGNLAVIRVVDTLAGPEGFNGQAGSDAQAGTLQARVSFAGGGLQVGVVAPGAAIGQRVGASAAGRGEVMQFGRIAGDGFTGFNGLDMQILAAPLPAAALQDLGVRQALSATSGLKP